MCRAPRLRFAKPVVGVPTVSRKMVNPLIMLLTVYAKALL